MNDLRVKIEIQELAAALSDSSVRSVRDRQWSTQMLTVQSARKLALHIADRYRSLGTDELRIHFTRMAGDGQDEEVWRAFRSAYFDALWAGAQEISAGPVITGSSTRKGWRLSAAGNITLSFTANERLELVDMNVELG